MAAKTEQSDPSRSMLQMPRDECRCRIDSQIDKGEALRDRPLANAAELNAAERDRERWHDYNKDLLRRMVNTVNLAVDYARVGRPVVRIVYPGVQVPLSEDVCDFREHLDRDINRLMSIRDRLELIPEDPRIAESRQAPEEATAVSSRKVFLVHGHDEEALHTVARCIERLDLEVLVLREQPSRGRTVIEKFEDYSDVAFAVVLLTPDDEGRGKGEEGLSPRARQNVIFELGFFVGKLGRERVCALHKGNVEILSDYEGVIWEPMDSDAWPFNLAREMGAAGLDVDLNKLA